MILKLFVIVVEEIVTINETYHKNLAVNLVVTLVQIRAHDVIITTLLKTILHIMILFDPVMIKITKLLFQYNLVTKPFHSCYC